MGGFYDHSQTLVELIDQYKFEKFAEIGVWKGRTAGYILKHQVPSLKEYYGIDQFKVLPPKHGHMGNMTQEDWEALGVRVWTNMKPYPRFRLIRLSSINASKIFPDGYFDLVFIDGSHFQEDLEPDIHAWLPKVRVGGLLTGHDYASLRHIEVKPTVDKIFGENIKILKGLVWVYEKKTT